MKTHYPFLLLALLLMATGCKQETSVTTSEPQAIAQNNDTAERIDFPDFGFMASSKHYKGRVFVLSDKFPTEKPVQDEGVKKLLSMDFKNDWKAYMQAVQEYVFEGNASTDYENAFFLEDNKVRNWFHVPWQHWGPTGREGFHGLTQEGPIPSLSLAAEQTATTHAYAVGFYNDLGGYTIGKVWPDETPNYSGLKYEGFPEGTVVAKLLFVPLPGDQVPYLENPVSWNAWVYENDLKSGEPKGDTTRVQSKVNVLQMDVMIKDPRAKETGGWIFGTYVYNGALGNANKWYNLMPVGIMWGNDPNETLSSYNPTPTETIINPKLKETKINDSPDLPPMHLGWASRLNGPADNSYSSCYSCHSTAEYPVISNILPMFNDPAVQIPKAGTNAPKEWMRWFRNIECGTPFDKEATSFDYSLQLAKSVQNYIEYATQNMKGKYHEEYWSKQHKIRRNSLLD